MKMRILIVEDDKLQFETIRKAISVSPYLGGAKVERIVTELEFREKFENIAAHNPTAILMDVMLKWTTKNHWVAPPQEVDEQGFFRAGLRCERLLAQDERTREIPVIIYSVLGKEDLEDDFTPRPNVKYVDKDFSHWGIEKAVRELLNA